jgi:hypothetical protein
MCEDEAATIGSEIIRAAPSARDEMNVSQLAESRVARWFTRNGAHVAARRLTGRQSKIMHRLARRSVRHHAMTMLSLLEAAEQVGKSKSTLWRASKRGELSVTKNEDGQILVDSSELFRVFQANRSEPRVMTQDAAVHVTHEAHDTALRFMQWLKSSPSELIIDHFRKRLLHQPTR